MTWNVSTYTFVCVRDPNKLDAARARTPITCVTFAHRSIQISLATPAASVNIREHSWNKLKKNISRIMWDSVDTADASIKCEHIWCTSLHFLWCTYLDSPFYSAARSYFMHSFECILLAFLDFFLYYSVPCIPFHWPYTLSVFIIFCWFPSYDPPKHMSFTVFPQLQHHRFTLTSCLPFTFSLFVFAASAAHNRRSMSKLNVPIQPYRLYKALCMIFSYYNLFESHNKIACALPWHSFHHTVYVYEWAAAAVKVCAYFFLHTYNSIIGNCVQSSHFACRLKFFQPARHHFGVNFCSRRSFFPHYHLLFLIRFFRHFLVIAMRRSQSIKI